MSTMVLHPAERDLAHWTIHNVPPDAVVEVSFDDGYTWTPLIFDGDEWTLWVQGPRAVPLDPDAMTLRDGVHQAMFRRETGQFIQVEDAGIIVVRDTCLAWPVDWACVSLPPDTPPEQIYRSERLAASTLSQLTLGRVGGCPVTVRPCAQSCSNGQDWFAGPNSTFFPHIGVGGRWVNSCGCSGTCHCGNSMSEVILDAPVGRIDEVWVHGVLLASSSYRVDDTNRLVRLDGDVWPSCQDMAQPHDGPDAFAVTYLNAYPVDAMGAIAAGVLANEFRKACAGQSCALPPGVVSLSRQGVSMEIARDLFSEGLTGIREVDTFTARYNPNRLRVRPQVFSPDVSSPRRTARVL